jgi:hypothetical protein
MGILGSTTIKHHIHSAMLPAHPVTVQTRNTRNTLREILESRPGAGFPIQQK